MKAAFVDSLGFGVAIFTVLNPLGAIPVFLSLTEDFGPEEIKKVSKSCSVAVFVALLVATFGGSFILSFFGIGIPAFRFAGGILIGLNAINMVQAKRAPTKLNKREISRIDDNEARELGIVPLAIPLLVGPGAISTAILYADKVKDQTTWIGIGIATLIIAIVVWITLNSSRYIGEKLGRIGINIMTRIMGLILLALSVEFVIKALMSIVPDLLVKG